MVSTLVAINRRISVELTSVETSKYIVNLCRISTVSTSKKPQKSGSDVVSRSPSQKTTFVFPILLMFVSLLSTCAIYPSDKAILHIRNFTDVTVVSVRVGPDPDNYGPNLIEAAIFPAGEVKVFLDLGNYVVFVSFEDGLFLEKSEIAMDSVGTYVLELRYGDE